MLTHNRLTRLIGYDRKSGQFVWRMHRGGRALSGELAGRKRPNGYVCIYVDGKHYYAHRLAWFYTYGKWPSKNLDHINGDPSDNRIENLREADQSENNANSRMRANNKSGLRGVSWNTKDRCWRAFISFRGEKRCLGSFRQKIDAYEAYLEAAKEIHGIFVRADAAKATTSPR